MGYTSQYPPDYNNTYVKATSEFSLYEAYRATDPGHSLIGNSNEHSWAGNSPTNLRFHIDLGSAKIIKRIYYENFHDNGSSTELGVKNFTFWGSNSATAFEELTYGIDTNWTQLTTASSLFDEHISSDIADPKYIVVTNSTAYRYYAFKFADKYTESGVMGVRRIELQISDSSSIQETILSDSAIKVIDNQKNILSDAVIGQYQKIIQSNTNIFATSQQLLFSDSKIVNQYQQTILSDAKIIIRKRILSNANIQGIIYLKKLTNFVTKLRVDKIIQTVFDTILNRLFKKVETNLTTRYKQNNITSTDLRTQLTDYDSIEPKSLNDIIVKKDGSELVDVDYSTLNIQFNLNRTPSRATFKLGRHHDDLDHTLDGSVSTITEKNKIQIYDGAILLFTGYITQIGTDSSTDTVDIVSEDIRCKINNISLINSNYKIIEFPSMIISEVSSLPTDVAYQILQNQDALAYGGKLIKGSDCEFPSQAIEETKDYLSTLYSTIEISTKTALITVLDFLISQSLLTGYELIDFGFTPEYTEANNDCGSLIDTLVQNSANINWYVDENEYLRFQKIEQGIVKTLPLSSINLHRHIYDVILDDILINKISDNYYQSYQIKLGKLHTRRWIQSKTNPNINKAPINYVKNLTWFSFQDFYTIPPHYQESFYIGEGLSRVYSYFSAAFCCVGYTIYQWLAKDTYENMDSVFVGSGAPQKIIYLSSYGKEVSNSYWEEKTINTGSATGITTGAEENTYLYEVRDENYDYINFAIDSANFELSQINKPISEAKITLLLDAFEYYGITLKDLINLSNTISADCYNNNNGFPLNIDNIIIDCSQRIVTLSITNYGKTYYQKTGNIMSNYSAPQYIKLMQRQPQRQYSQGL